MLSRYEPVRCTVASVPLPDWLLEGIEMVMGDRYASASNDRLLVVERVELVLGAGDTGDMVAPKAEPCGALEDPEFGCEAADDGAPDLMLEIDFAEPGLLDRRLKAIMDSAATLTDNSKTARPAPFFPACRCLPSSGQWISARQLGQVENVLSIQALQ
jgi:hypothetical protein